MGRIHGVGINDRKYPCCDNGKLLKVYQIWAAMLQRCYSDVNTNKSPTYRDCTVSDNFKNYSYFYEWYNAQAGVEEGDWAIDKDLLFKGNKVYSEDTCVLVPRKINQMLVNPKKCRGELPIGVDRIKKTGKYRALVCLDRKRLHLGHFDTALEAFEAYKTAKEGHIKIMANRYKEKLDPRVYEALINWKIEITD